MKSLADLWFIVQTPNTSVFFISSICLEQLFNFVLAWTEWLFAELHAGFIFHDE
jgi:hypothetical protein